MSLNLGCSGVGGWVWGGWIGVVGWVGGCGVGRELVA